MDFPGLPLRFERRMHQYRKTGLEVNFTNPRAASSV
jgi:hypothetical protein